MEDFRPVFDNGFFERALNIKALNDAPFKIRSFTTDSRSTCEQNCFIGIKGEKFDGNDFFETAYEFGTRVFVLQKKPADLPDDAVVYLVDDTVGALGALASERRSQLKIPNILITGSVGKTTTRIMLTYILREKYPVLTAQQNWNNAIGLPLTILSAKENDKAAVLEAGMNAKGEIAYLSEIDRPDIAVITNVGLSHSKYLGGIEDVAEAKAEICAGMDENSILLINEHDPFRGLFEERAKGRVLYFDPESLFVSHDGGLEGFEFQSKKYPYQKFFCPIPGEHLLLNLSIIFALVDILDIPLENINKGLNAMHGLGHRLDVFKNKRNATIIADCYNASLESFKAGLDVLGKAKGRKIAVIGSVLELGDSAMAVHEEIIDYINKVKPDLVLAVGDDFGTVCGKLTVPYCHFADKEDIWTTLESDLKDGDTVLVKASNGVGLSVIVDCLSSI